MPSPKLLTATVFSALSFVSSALAAGNGALNRQFDKADIDESGTLTPTEFLALEPRGKSWVDAQHRFNFADADHNGLLSDVEFRASNGGKEGGKPSKAQKFDLADLDDDGFLTPEEFALTLAQSKPWRKVLREFDRKDRGAEDSLLSPAEFGVFISPL